MKTNKDNSIWMDICLKIGLVKLAWSLRRLHCPVDGEALVLEVGSGGNPYFRANVLLDAFETTRQRHWAPLVADRPTVLGRIEQLPFRDNAFDFVIASHVLEHTSEPELFLSELQRVAKAGYIEVPDAFMERLNPYKDHRLEITDRNGTLTIRKKSSWQSDPDLTQLYEAKTKKHIALRLIPHQPFDFHVRYYWQEKINSKLLNPEVSASWEAPSEERHHITPTFKMRINSAVLALVRLVFSQTFRNKKIVIEDLVACPSCKSVNIIRKENKLVCCDCRSKYPINNGIPALFANNVEKTVMR